MQAGKHKKNNLHNNSTQFKFGNLIQKHSKLLADDFNDKIQNPFITTPLNKVRGHKPKALSQNDFMLTTTTLMKKLSLIEAPGAQNFLLKDKKNNSCHKSIEYLSFGPSEAYSNGENNENKKITSNKIRVLKNSIASLTSSTIFSDLNFHSPKQKSPSRQSFIFTSQSASNNINFKTSEKFNHDRGHLNVKDFKLEKSFTKVSPTNSIYSTMFATHTKNVKEDQDLSIFYSGKLKAALTKATNTLIPEWVMDKISNLASQKVKLSIIEPIIEFGKNMKEMQKNCNMKGFSDSRKNFLKFVDWFQKSIQNLKKKNLKVFPEFFCELQSVFTVGIVEIMQNITGENYEKGKLFEAIWDSYLNIFSWVFNLLKTEKEDMTATHGGKEKEMQLNHENEIKILTSNILLEKEMADLFQKEAECLREQLAYSNKQLNKYNYLLTSKKLKIKALKRELYSMHSDYLKIMNLYNSLAIDKRDENSLVDINEISKYMKILEENQKLIQSIHNNLRSDISNINKKIHQNDIYVSYETPIISDFCCDTSDFEKNFKIHQVAISKSIGTMTNIIQNEDKCVGNVLKTFEKQCQTDDFSIHSECGNSNDNFLDFYCGDAAEDKNLEESDHIKLILSKIQSKFNSIQIELAEKNLDIEEFFELQEFEEDEVVENKNLEEIKNHINENNSRIVRNKFKNVVKNVKKSMMVHPTSEEKEKINLNQGGSKSVAKHVMKLMSEVQSRHKGGTKKSKHMSKITLFKYIASFIFASLNTQDQSFDVHLNIYDHFVKNFGIPAADEKMIQFIGSCQFLMRNSLRISTFSKFLHLQSPLGKSAFKLYLNIIKLIPLESPSELSLYSVFIQDKIDIPYNKILSISTFFKSYNSSNQAKKLIESKKQIHPHQKDKITVDFDQITELLLNAYEEPIDLLKADSINPWIDMCFDAIDVYKRDFISLKECKIVLKSIQSLNNVTISKIFSYFVDIDNEAMSREQFIKLCKNYGYLNEKLVNSFLYKTSSRIKNLLDLNTQMSLVQKTLKIILIQERKYTIQMREFVNSLSQITKYAEVPIYYFVRFRLLENYCLNLTKKASVKKFICEELEILQGNKLDKNYTKY